jgi:hypothetical protein
LCSCDCDPHSNLITTEQSGLSTISDTPPASRPSNGFFIIGTLAVTLASLRGSG